MTFFEEINKKLENEYIGRNYLGLSEIGNPCQLYLWLQDRGYGEEEAIPPPGRILQLFDDGNRVEEDVIRKLRYVGVDVFDEQGEAEIIYKSKSLLGHIDGMLTIDGFHHILEIKSSNLKGFRRIVKLKSYKDWNIKYYAQTQAYMLALDMPKAYIIVYCKDNSDWYEEVVELDEDCVLEFLETVFDTLRCKQAPAVECSSKDFYVAKMCKFRHVCFKKEN